MAARKLQQDIDKTFKKVAEGITAFETIFEKIQQTSNSSQKEKLEDSLKREIKKLQRHRDQIKTWAAGNEIKDKKPLLEQRKLIENEMEKFKAVEKEMKTKAFSKEGLSAAAKLDPKEKEKLAGCAFLSEMVEDLERQIETLEAEEEGLQATVKRGKKDASKADRLAEISRWTERHKYHQGKLELLLRALENGNVDIEQLNEIKDSIKYYVEENQSVEFLEDETIYDDFNLDQDEASWGITNEVDRVSSQDTQSIHDDNADVAETRSGSVPNSKQKSTASDGPSSSTRRPSNQLKSPLPALATLHTPLAGMSNGAASNMKPAPLPTRAPETLKYASAAAAAASNEKSSSIAPLPPPPAATSIAVATGPSSSIAPLPPPPSKAASGTSPNSAHPVSIASHAGPSKTGAQSSTLGTTTTSSQPPAQSPTISLAATSSFPPTPSLEKSEAILPSRAKQPQTLAAPKEEHEESPEPEQPLTPPTQSRQTPETHSESGAHEVPEIENAEESIYHLPPGLQDLIQSFEVTKNRSSAPSSQQMQRLLSASYATCPDILDAEKPRHYKPQNSYNTPRYYPQEPLNIVDDPTLYSRIDNDTLFFIFYYRQNTYQQYLAAKSLKSQSWRFHKQYQTWFQRHEEPKTITEEYEQGTYRFFDYESTWMNRRKADFKFAYKYLEDDL